MRFLWVKKFIYWCGFLPEPGTLFFSPALDILWRFKYEEPGVKFHVTYRKDGTIKVTLSIPKDKDDDDNSVPPSATSPEGDA